MTMDSFTAKVRSSGRRGDVNRVDFARSIRYSLAPFSSRRRTPRAGARAIRGPGREKADNAREHPPRLPDCQSALRVRRHLGDAVDARRPAPRYLQQLPSLLHREAKADRHAGAHRPVQEEVRQRSGYASEEEGRQEGSREKGSRRQAEEGEEGRRQGLRRPTSEKRRAAGRGTLRPFSFHGARGGRSGTPEENGGGGRRGRGGESRPTA